MLWYGKCYFCICRVCNMAGCRYKKRWDRCLACHKLNNTAILNCDHFASRYEMRVFRVKRGDARAGPSVERMVRELWEAMKGK